MVCMWQCGANGYSGDFVPFHGWLQVSFIYDCQGRIYVGIHVCWIDGDACMPERAGVFLIHAMPIFFLVVMKITVNY